MQFGITHAQTLAKQYRTSMEATVNRYVELTSDACAFVFSKDNMIRYVRRTDTFPRLATTRGDRLPDRCASLKVPATPLRVATGWTELDGSVWLETAWGKQPPPVLEQSVRQSGGFQITLLFVATTGAEEDEEDAELEESYAVRFRRG